MKMDKNFGKPHVVIDNGKAYELTAAEIAALYGASDRRRDGILKDSQATLWLKEAILNVDSRDPLEAYYDAQLLFAFMAEKLEDLGIEPAELGGPDITIIDCKGA